MSLYNMVHGVNPLAPSLLHMLEIDVSKVDRLRDCYLARGEGESIEIHIYTRTGGGNRADYQRSNAYLTSLPQYLGDSDVSHDSTYAIFRFRIPTEYVDKINSLVKEVPQAIAKSPAERFEELLQSLEKKS